MKDILRSVLLVVLFILVEVLVFAIFVKLFEISDGLIQLINQLLKVVAILLGCLLGIKSDKNFIKGLAVGFFAMLISYCLFTILAHSAFFRISLLYELLFGGVLGGLSGGITGLLRRH